MATRTKTSSTFRRLAAAFSIFTIAQQSCFAAPKIITNVTVESDAVGKFDTDAPCFIVYPEGDAIESLVDAKATTVIEQALQKKGYQLVSNPNEAATFIKVDFARLEPFEASVTLTNRGSFDYSSAASTRNYAATMAGGRYQSLGDPSRSRDLNQTGYVLDPLGKPIDVGQQKDRETTFVEGESKEVTLLLHPIVMQITAWKLEKLDVSFAPTELWKTTASIETVMEESVEDQLHELAVAASKHFGKKLRKPKILPRKSRD